MNNKEAIQLRHGTPEAIGNAAFLTIPALSAGVITLTKAL